MHSRLSQQDKNTQNKKEMNTSEGNVDKKGSGDVWSDLESTPVNTTYFGLNVWVIKILKLTSGQLHVVFQSKCKVYSQEMMN